MFNFIAKRKLLKYIALDRICRLSDIGLKDLSFEIIRTERVNVHSKWCVEGPANIFHVQFYYSDPRVLKGNPRSCAGKVYEVYTFNNCAWIEEKVAEEIRAIKARSAQNSQYIISECDFA